MESAVKRISDVGRGNMFDGVIESGIERISYLSAISTFSDTEDSNRKLKH